MSDDLSKEAEARAEMFFFHLEAARGKLEEMGPCVVFAFDSETEEIYATDFDVEGNLSVDAKQAFAAGILAWVDEILKEEGDDNDEDENLGFD